MRIGINIPNDLMERFKPMKSSRNLSKICRDAITAQVEAYEAAVTQVDSEADSIEALTDRLALEYLRKTEFVDWQALGREDGKEWVHAVTLEDFERLFHNLAAAKKNGAPKLVIGFLAGSPTFLSPFPSSRKATIEGVVLRPSLLGITTGSLPSITETQEFVVPKSIPIIFPIVC